MSQSPSINFRVLLNPHPEVKSSSMHCLKGLALLLMGSGLSACNDAPDMGDFRLGITNSCRIQAPFVSKSGLAQPVAIDSRQQGHKGLRLINPRTRKTWQHPSWDDIGFVGAFDRDHQGNIYLSALANVHVSPETLALSNTLYRIDAQSGEMKPFMELPSVNPPSPSNPFGIIGLYFDCDSNSLYVSSVAGSSAKEVLGRIFQVDVANKKIVSQLEKTDAFGIATFNGMKNKRLYLSSARTSDIYSVVLDAKGRFTQDIKYEFSLAKLPGGDSSNIRKFDFRKTRGGSYTMRAKEEAFRFSLMAARNPMKRIYRFNYVPESDSWKFQNIETGQ